jgi:hypothetical protein
MTYFITGLPRSRTAWFANYMSYGNSACLHDKFRDVGLDASALNTEMQCTGAAHIGHADPANLFVAEQLMELHPNSRWLVIRRKPLECFKSVSAYNPEYRLSAILSLARTMSEFIRRWEPMVVDFNDLTPATVERAANHLVPGWTCPKWRTEMLCNMQVQLEPEFMKKEINRLKKDYQWAQ